jgi:ribonuclease D
MAFSAVRAAIVAGWVAAACRTSTGCCDRTSTILDASRPMSQSESNRAVLSISAVAKAPPPPQSAVRSAESNHSRRKRRRKRRDHEGQSEKLNGSLESSGAAGTDDTAPDERRPSKRRRCRNKTTPAKAEESLAGSNESLPAKENPVEMLSISRDFIERQPRLEWTGSIKILNTRAEMKAAVQEILEACQSSQCHHLGMDTETKPVFKRGHYNPTALIQLATDKDVYLFRICKLPNHSFEPLIPILTNPNILKTGVSIHGDVKALQRIIHFEPAGFVDCSDAAFRTLNIQNRGLAALTAHFLHGRLCKKQTMSNWAVEPNLSPRQIRYAATDAWVSRQVHIRISEAVVQSATASTTLSTRLPRTPSSDTSPAFPSI